MPSKGQNQKILLAIDKGTEYFGSQESFAIALGVNRRTIYTWGAGNRNISMARMEQIVKATKQYIKYDDFFQYVIK